MANQPGGMGAGPRVALEDAFRDFRVLNLAEKSITTVRILAYFCFFAAR